MPIENVGRLAAFSDTQAAITAATAGLSEILFSRRTSDNALGFSVDAGVTWYFTSSTGGGVSLGTGTPTDISGSGLAGNSASAAPSNHVHRGVLSISASGNAPSYGGITFIPGTNASISQSGASITISGGSGGGGTSTSVVAGVGASVSNNGAGVYTVGLTGSGWSSAIQLANRATGVTYANGSLTRIISAVYATSTTVLAQADLQLKTGAASPPTNIVNEFQMSGVADSEKIGLHGLVLPNEYYTILDLSQAGASINLYKWIEYDDYGGAPATAVTTANTNQVYGGRITLDGSNAIPTTDVTAASAVWYVPYVGNNISLYTSGSVWNTIIFSSASLALTGLSPNSNYDLWGFQNGTELSLRVTRWNPNDTLRVNGLSYQDGIQTEALNRTNVFLGTFRITGTSAQSEDSLQRRLVWNNYNRVSRKLLRQEGNTAWTYNSAVLRQANAASANFVSAVTGLAENPVHVEVTNQLSNNSVAAFGIVAIGVDSTTVNSADANAEVGLNTTTAIHIQATATLDHQSLGYHAYNWLESARSGSMNFDPSESTENMLNGIVGRMIG